jgi:hypothetical protein
LRLRGNGYRNGGSDDRQPERLGVQVHMFWRLSVVNKPAIVLEAGTVGSGSADFF